MRDAKSNKSWISKIVVGVMALQLMAPAIQGAAAAGVVLEGGEASVPQVDIGSSVTDTVYQSSLGLSVTDAVYQIQNPGFEEGDMSGWTVVRGQAFGQDSVSGGEPPGGRNKFRTTRKGPFI